MEFNAQELIDSGQAGTKGSLEYARNLHPELHG